MDQIGNIISLVLAVAALCGVLYKVLAWMSNIVEGIRCQLRTEMLRTYYRHKDEKTIRQYERENFDHNFAAYKAMGGNSFIDTVNNEVLEWEVIS